MAASGSAPDTGKALGWCSWLCQLGLDHRPHTRFGFSAVGLGRRRNNGLWRFQRVPETFWNGPVGVGERLRSRVFESAVTAAILCTIIGRIKRSDIFSMFISIPRGSMEL